MDFAGAMNERFMSDDDGIFLHLGYWWGNELGNKKSSTLINKYGTIAGRLTLYKDGARPAIFMKPQAQRSVLCMAPCDMASNQRVNHGCGAWGSPTENYHGGHRAAWCGEELYGITGSRKQFPCAMHPNETRRMLHAFRDVQYNNNSALLQPPLGRGGDSPCGYYQTPPNEYNEVVHAIDRWNEYVKYDLWAFGLTSTCKADKSKFQGQTCEENVMAQAAEFKEWSGREPPIVFVDMANLTHPFSYLSGPPGPSTCAEFGCRVNFHPQQACQCNDECEDFGNCCDDYSGTCQPTCAALGCDDYNPNSLCQCNDECEDFGNCCADYAATCGKEYSQQHNETVALI